MEAQNSTSKVPDWINSGFLAKILSQNCEEPQIKSWKVENATSAGDNYASAIYRVTVDLIRDDKPENLSLIMKLQLTYGEVSKVSRKQCL